MDQRTKLNAIRLLAKGDDRYYSLLKELRILEKEYNRVLSALPEQEQDIICNFISVSEEMTWRMLEIACRYMDFPSE